MNPLLTATDSGTVLTGELFSNALEIHKSYKVYLPPSYEESNRRYPVLYLFRGHEREWFDPYQDHSRGGNAIQHLMDELIHAGTIGEMIVVGAGLTSTDGEIYGLGINFLNPRLAKQRKGIGTGQFEDYVVRDLIPHIDSSYRTLPDRRYRGTDGFSLGGYTAIMLAIRHPRLFASVGCYDGSHMFHELRDPRTPGQQSDTLWMRNDAMFAPAFRRPGDTSYDREYMNGYNPLSRIRTLDEEMLDLIRTIRFYVTTAAFDGYQGNRDRGVHLMSLFHLAGIENEADGLILSSDAHHTWKFADLHMRSTLPKHSRAMRARRLKQSNGDMGAYLTHIEIIELSDGGTRSRRVRLSYRIYQRVPLKIEILSLHGEVLNILRFEVHECGRHNVVWEGDDRNGAPVSSGVYYIQLTTPAGTIRRRCVLLR